MSQDDEPNWPAPATTWQAETQQRQVERKKSTQSQTAEGKLRDDDAGRWQKFVDEARSKHASSSDAAAKGDRVGLLAAIEVCLEWDRFEGSFATSYEPQRHTTMVLGRPVQVLGIMTRRPRVLSC